MGIAWECDTLDYGDHLNYYGQAKATRALAGYLAGLNLLTDHRSDSAYSDPWNRDLAAYYDELAGRSQAPDHVSDSQPPA